MVSIIVQNASLTFPLIGTDARFIRRGKTKINGKPQHVGGEIITNSGRKNGIEAIKNLSITLKKGDRLGIHGHNGAGKTTFLRMLSGIYPPTSGSILIEGRVTSLFSLKLGINPELSGYENIKIKAMMYGLRRRDILPMIPEIVEFSELGEYIYMPVKTYSSGMVLRLQFSIATSLQPDILLIDEWISTADKQFRDKIDERLERMIENTSIVVIASHNQNRLNNWANRVLHLKNGQVVLDEDTSDIKSTHSHKPNPTALKQFRLHFNTGQYERALQLINEVWPEDVVPYEYNYWRANIYYKANNFQAAYEAYQAVLVIKPGIPKVHDQLGRLLMREGKDAEAEKHLKISLRLSGGTLGSVAALKKVVTRQKRAVTEVDEFLANLQTLI